MAFTDPQPPPLLESVPGSMQKMLIREAALSIARRRILNAIPLAQAREREVKATRAPFHILLPTKANQEIRTQLEDTRQTLANLQSELETLTSLESHILPLVARRVETHLRRSSPDYVKGLASNRHPDDWVRIKIRLEDCILAYRESLKTLADLCPTLPANTVLAAHPPAFRQITHASTWGERLENETLFINTIADTQRIQRGPGEFTLRRQFAANWKESVQSLLTLDAKTAAFSVRDLMAQAEPITQRILTEVSSEQQLVLHNPDHGLADYHAGQWTAFREAALLKINPALADSLAKETKTLLETGEFEAWSWLDEPPPAIPAQPAAPSLSRPPFPSTNPPFAKPVPPPSREPVLKLPSRAATRPPFPPASS